MKKGGVQFWLIAMIIAIAVLAFALFLTGKIGGKGLSEIQSCQEGECVPSTQECTKESPFAKCPDNSKGTTNKCCLIK
tara:strand:+ start:84 stop:317 length:234 start_codon:yes stop_codon:yes gene_type:complete